VKLNIILLIPTLFFCSAILSPKGVHAAEEPSLGALINQLSTNYSFLNEEFEKLEQDIRGFSRTSLNISVIKRGNSKFNLTSVEILENDNLLTEHFYSSIENRALDAGGRHQIFNEEFRGGKHTLKAIYYWTEDGSSVKSSKLLIPINVSIGRTQLLELAFEKKDDKVNLKHHQFNFAVR